MTVQKVGCPVCALYEKVARPVSIFPAPYSQSYWSLPNSLKLLMVCVVNRHCKVSSHISIPQQLVFAPIIAHFIYFISNPFVYILIMRGLRKEYAKIMRGNPRQRDYPEWVFDIAMRRLNTDPDIIARVESSAILSDTKIDKGSNSPDVYDNIEEVVTQVIGEMIEEVCMNQY